MKKNGRWLIRMQDRQKAGSKGDVGENLFHRIFRGIQDVMYGILEGLGTDREEAPAEEQDILVYSGHDGWRPKSGHLIRREQLIEDHDADRFEKMQLNEDLDVRRC